MRSGYGNRASASAKARHTASQRQTPTYFNAVSTSVAMAGVRGACFAVYWRASEDGFPTTLGGGSQRNSSFL
jgi:phosphotransferase system  glucose/maltose/N-acetylglucosamine-specific IIC component